LEAWDDPVTLRNFGLSFSRRSVARPNVGISWRPAHGVGAAVLIVILIVLALLL
jgi:hypothetical protein